MDKLKAAEEKQAVHEAKSVAAVAASDKQALVVKAMEEASQAFEAVSIADVLPEVLPRRSAKPDPPLLLPSLQSKAELQGKLQSVEQQAKELEANCAAAASTVEEQAERLKQCDQEIMTLGEASAFFELVMPSV
jgi:hypothetical protein